MARKSHIDFSLDTMTLEGALFMPDLLEKASMGEATYQRSTDYQVPKGLSLQDECGRAFQIACAQFKTFALALKRRDMNPLPVTRAYVGELFSDVLGFTDLQQLGIVDLSGRGYPITAMVRGRVPVVVAPYDLGLDDPDPRFAVTGLGNRKKAAARLAQEFLDAAEANTWALVTNGRRIRLLRDAATLTRPTYLEFDLETILSEKRYPDFKAFWRIMHASRAGIPGTSGHECIWERWRKEGQDQGNRVREGLRNGVTAALMALGEGFLSHPGNDPLRLALRNGNLRSDSYFQQLLRLIYRFLFLFTVEERDNILHTPDESPLAIVARSIYAEGYSMRRLRDRAMRRSSYDAHDDLWQAVCIVFKGLAHGESRLALPALGGLFAPDQCLDLDSSNLSNQALLAAMRSLRWSVIDGTLSPVDYRNRGFEELGSVYESLLELVPEIDLAARRFSFVGIADSGSTAGNARKTTGSYYTPDSLVQELIKSALDPVIEARIEASLDNPAQAILDITVIDPACGSGHFLLAAARRLAGKLAELQAIDGAVMPADYRHALREVIKHCIYGVDRNPMALELARTALWLDGFEPGRALSFLDHHLICGDALLGLTDLRQLSKGIPDDAFKALSGDDKEVCKILAQKNKTARKSLEKKRLGPDLFAQGDWQDACAPIQIIETLPDDTPEQCAEKQQAWLKVLLHTTESPLAHAADLYIGAFLSPKKSETENFIPTTANICKERFNEVRNADHEVCLKNAQNICKQARVLHWPLELAPVFAKGGFDCVLANPPWERIKLQEEEFFATRHPLVAKAKNKAERGKRIDLLSKGVLARHLFPELQHNGHETDHEMRLYAEFISARRTAEAASIYSHLKNDEDGRFPLTGVGDVNTYALFAETISQIVKKTGRAGFIVPTGIATDDSTKKYFTHLIQEGNLVEMLSFENEEFIFHEVHHAFKFCLMVIGENYYNKKPEFVFFARQPEAVLDANRRFTLEPSDFELINPNTRTCPIFRSRADAELTKKIYSHVPVLIRDASTDKEEVNPWGISFLRMFDMSNDSHVFADTYSEKNLPLYEAKMIHQFDHRWASYNTTEAGADETVDVTQDQKQDPSYLICPRYWVCKQEVLARIARAPRAVTKAYTEDDYDALLAAFANWIEACFEEDLKPTAYRHETKTLTDLAGPLFIASLNNTKWRNQKVQVEARTYPSLTEEEMFIIRTSSSIRLASDTILDARSPRWLIGWRRNARVNDERTTIASVINRSAVGDSIFVFNTTEPPSNAAVLLGLINSLIFDYIARQKIGGVNYSFYFMKQMPVLPPDNISSLDQSFIVPRVLELTYTSHDLKNWASDLGYNGTPFGFNQVRRAILRAELDAYYAKMYGLARDELRYILDPAEVMGREYPTETFRVLKKSEEAKYGEYRTRRLVLEAWDRIAQDLDSSTSIQLTSSMLANIQRTIHDTSYPIADMDKAICGIALAVLEKSSPLDSISHLYAVLLGTHPSWCRSFLPDHDKVQFDHIIALGPKLLQTDVAGSIKWKQVRDYLELQKAIIVDRSNNMQSISLADATEQQARFPKPAADFTEFVMKSLSAFLSMKKGQVAQNQEQQEVIRILDLQQTSEYALAS